MFNPYIPLTDQVDFDTFYCEMLRKNEDFRKFVNDNKSKTIEELALEYGIDIELIGQFK